MQLTKLLEADEQPEVAQKHLNDALGFLNVRITEIQEASARRRKVV